MNTSTSILITIGSALACSSLFCYITRWFFKRGQLLDRPGTEAHKLQKYAVPYGGGSGFVLAFTVCILFFAIWPQQVIEISSNWLWILGGGAALFFLGQYDDIRPMRARWKFLLQTIICTIIVHQSNLQIDALQDIPALSNVIAIFWLLTICNAFNLLDHGDGVSAGTGLISAGVLVAAAVTGGDMDSALLYSLFIGSLAGFLVWNAPPARLYMGDAGSLPLGYLIGVGTLLVSFAPIEPTGDHDAQWPITLLAPLLITAVPIYDMGAVIAKRFRAKKPLFRGDRNHISHRLERLGLTARSRLAVTVSLHLALAGSALLLRESTPIQISIILGQTAAILLAVLLLETTRDHG